MEIEEFKSFVVKDEGGKFISRIEKRKITDLPDNEMIIKVKYSSLNYKDALSSIGKKGIAKKYPHVPGIDASGTVLISSSEKLKEGENVIVTGFGLGMETPGGFSEYIKVPADWSIKLPENLSLKESMILGTAGFTAALALYKLEQFGLKESGEVLVTGATGSLGSMAVSLLSKAGYENITAATGKLDRSDFLKHLGANKVVDRNSNEIDDRSNRALLSGRWTGVIDSVGGNILATALKSTKYGGTVAACGLTQSDQLNSTVYPFILRGINLIGIDSAECPLSLRNKIWDKLSKEWKLNFESYPYQEISLDKLNDYMKMMLQGKNVGRVIINLEG